MGYVAADPAGGAYSGEHVYLLRIYLNVMQAACSMHGGRRARYLHSVMKRS